MIKANTSKKRAHVVLHQREYHFIWGYRLSQRIHERLKEGLNKVEYSISKFEILRKY